MSETIDVTLKVWRQAGPDAPGRFSDVEGFAGRGACRGPGGPDGGKVLHGGGTSVDPEHPNGAGSVRRTRKYPPLSSVIPTTGPATRLELVNSTSADVRLFWLDFSGERQAYGEIAPAPPSSVAPTKATPGCSNPLPAKPSRASRPSPPARVLSSMVPHPATTPPRPAAPRIARPTRAGKSASTAPTSPASPTRAATTPRRPGRPPTTRWASRAGSTAASISSS